MQALTGQADPPAFCTFQLSGGPNANLLNISQAQLDLARNPPFPDWFLFGPGYAYLDDQFHYTPNGARNFGAKFGQLFHKIFTLGQGWLPLSPTQVTCRGNQILIDFHVPEPPLAFDVAYLATTPILYPDYGFAATDSAGLLNVVSVAFPTLPDGTTADACVLITVDRTIAAGCVVTYADGPNHNGTGNLRDSDPTVSHLAYAYTDFSGQLPQENIPALIGKPYELFNWCCLFQQAATAN